MYGFAERQKARFHIATMARVLGVSRSGLYARRTRPKSLRALEDEVLADMIKTIYAGSRGTYGAPRIQAELELAHGISCSRRRIARLNDPPDAVVGESPVHRLDELDRAEVAHPQPRLDRGVAERDEQMALAGAGRADEHEVLLGPDPLQRRQVLEGRPGHRGLGDLELGEGLAHGEGGARQARALVGLIPRAHLRLDERAQELLRRPALDLRDLQDLRRHLAYGPQLEPFERLLEIRREGRRGRAHAMAYSASERTGTAGSVCRSGAPGAAGCITPPPASRIERTSAAR